MALKKPFYCEGCGKKLGYDEYSEYSGKCQDCKALEVLLKTTNKPVEKEKE